MATKNRIVHRLWIIQITTIPRDKISKQNCLRFLYQERVGVVSQKILSGLKPSVQATFDISKDYFKIDFGNSFKKL